TTTATGNRPGRAGGGLATASPRSREWLSGRVRLEERPGRIHPVDGLGHRAVEVVDEAQDPLLQVFQRAEAGPPQQFPDQDAEPDLYLVQPRAVLGRVHEPDPVAGVAQELCPARLRLQHPAL